MTAGAGPARSTGLLSTGTWAITPVRHEKVTVAHGPQAAAEARRAVDRVLAGYVDEERLATLHLLVTELVSNAVRHGDADAEAPPVVHLALAPGCVRVEVCDRGPGFSPRRPAPYGDGGYGLFLVDALATRWGVAGDDSNCVWFELAHEDG